MLVAGLLLLKKSCSYLATTFLNQQATSPMEQHIDLSLAHEMGYYSSSDITLKLTTSPKSSQRGNQLQGMNRQGGPDAPLQSPPIESFSAFRFEDNPSDIENAGRSSRQPTSERPSPPPLHKSPDLPPPKFDASKQPKEPPMPRKLFAPLRDFKKLQATVNHMKKYHKMWVKRDALSRKFSALVIQCYARGYITRSSLLAKSSLPSSSALLKAWAYRRRNPQAFKPPSPQPSPQEDPPEEKYTPPPAQEHAPPTTKAVIMSKKKKHSSVYFDTDDSQLPPSRADTGRAQSVYYDPSNEQDEPDMLMVSQHEFNSLKAEVRAATEIAAVAKFHSQRLEKELKAQQDKFASMEEVVHLLLKEVAHLGHEEKKVMSRSLRKAQKGQISMDDFLDVDRTPEQKKNPLGASTISVTSATSAISATSISSVPTPPPPKTPHPGPLPPTPKSSRSPDAAIWMETLDEKTGLIYYFNAETSETSWLPPDGAKIVEVSPL